MLRYLSLCLIAIVYAKKGGGGKPDKTGSTINSCDAQQECLSVDSITQTTSYIGTFYEVCIMWEDDLSGCSKGVADTLESICYGQSIGDHKGKCKSKEPVCQIVKCGEYAAFGIDDNADCESSSGKFATGFAFSGVQCVICKSGTQGHMCDDGCHKNCIWYIPAPKCTTTTKTPTKKPTDKPTPKPTMKPTTADPTTASPTTSEPTTADPTTASPTTSSPTTADPTTAEPSSDPTIGPTELVCVPIFNGNTACGRQPDQFDCENGEGIDCEWSDVISNCVEPCSYPAETCEACGCELENG